MKVSRKYSKLAENQIEKISLSLVTAKDVLEWSCGEVTKPETINYKTYKPERDGLFDELIFGPVADHRCPICSKKYKKSNEGTTCSATVECEKLKPEILPRISRRSRMGHISLKAPIVHFWFFKLDHSIISKLLGLKCNQKPISKSQIEDVIYYKSHIVLESGGLKSLPKNKIIDVSDAAQIYHDVFDELAQRYEKGSEEYREITEAANDLYDFASSKMGKDYGIDFFEMNEIIEYYSKDTKINTGSTAIEYLLKNVDLEHEKKTVKEKIKEIDNLKLENKKDKIPSTKKTERDKLYKRLQVINAFLESKQDPTSMLIYELPVLPVDLRPLIQLDGGRHSTSDVNELYRKIIIRNARVGKWMEEQAPILLIQNEIRMLQEAIDALIDNQKRQSTPFASKEGRPLKSISDALTGKKGRFRQNLLGKRVDYSARSVIVVGPELKMHQVGVPREIAAKLFEPWIIRALIQAEEAISLKQARKLIEEFNPVIWPYVEKVINKKPVLLNRAPTLHRLSIQAFEPVLVRGKAIKLHPLVTAAFNADFDGDQMAIHVPISEQAILEARELMLANKNILGPKDGEPIINPGQDIVLGIYYLTTEIKGAKGEGTFYKDYDTLIKAYENETVSLHARVLLPYKEVKPFDSENDGFIVSTVGKLIFNKIFPDNFPFVFDNNVEDLFGDYSKQKAKYIIKPGKITSIEDFVSSLPINKALNKKNIAKVISQLFYKYVQLISMSDIAQVIKQIHPNNLDDLEQMYAELFDYKNEPLSDIHVKFLAKTTRNEFVKIQKRLTTKLGIARIFEDEERAELLDNIWFLYTNIVASFLDDLKNLGFKYSTQSGASYSVYNIVPAPSKTEYIQEGDRYTNMLKQKFNKGIITNDEKYKLTIDKWSNIKEKVQKELLNIINSNDDPFNPIFMMINSGSRGTITNLVQFAGMRGLMANNTKTLKAHANNDEVVRSIIEVPVKSSFLEGLTSYEFYSSTHGARKGMTDTALNTAKSGYLTRRLVDVSQNIVVREKDCGSDFGVVVKDIVDTKTGQIIVSLRERIEGRFTNGPVMFEGQEIIPESTFITPELAQKVISLGIEKVEIRSILGCNTKSSVCKKCYGKDLSTNRVVNIGEAVGIIAAQSIGEPGTQLTMRTFHTGGVAGVEDITGGFSRLIELIDAYDSPWGKPAVISHIDGVIESIEPKLDSSNIELVKIRYENGENIETIAIDASRKKRVKVGDKVVPGQKITEGPIVLKQLLKYSDLFTVQNYLLKEIQKIYRMQGISISDKYIEIVIRQMISKILITSTGDSEFFEGMFVDIFEYQEVNGKLLSEGKTPALGQVVIKGAKQIPLLSDSFLAAASYQETSKILVHASISNKIDNLEGLKENIIVGHKIPAGTNSNFEPKSKFDIRSSRSFFEKKIMDSAQDN